MDAYFCPSSHILTQKKFFFIDHVSSIWSCVVIWGPRDLVGIPRTIFNGGLMRKFCSRRGRLGSGIGSRFARVDFGSHHWGLFGPRWNVIGRISHRQRFSNGTVSMAVVRDRVYIWWIINHAVTNIWCSIFWAAIGISCSWKKWWLSAFFSIIYMPLYFYSYYAMYLYMYIAKQVVVCNMYIYCHAELGIYSLFKSTTINSSDMQYISRGYYMTVHTYL